MAASISAATTSISAATTAIRHRGAGGGGLSLLDPRLFSRHGRRRLERKALTLCFVMAEERKPAEAVAVDEAAAAPPEMQLEDALALASSASRAAERQARKKAERQTYLVAAVLSSLGITSMAIAAVYYRFSWQMDGGEVSIAEMFATFSLSVGAAVGMEFWAKWAHRALWHASLWEMHESHHRPREGPFEVNDVFAVVNAVPAISLLNYGFFHHGLFSGLCFGAGLGITLFGMAYMFVHDGLVHRRFPVGPIADVPYLRKVAAAHQMHHSEKFGGVPYGLFLGPMELEEVGGLEELEREIDRRMKVRNVVAQKGGAASDERR
ncbi:beta-carotene hydroxylase 2, chloroplastic-like [Wolffia australiana]